MIIIMYVCNIHKQENGLGVYNWASPWGLRCWRIRLQCRRPGIPRLGRSSGGGNGNSLQYSCLKISADREPGGLQSMGSQRVRHNWAHRASSQHVDVLTNLEAPQALFRDFYGDFIARVWLIKSLAIGDWIPSLARLLNPPQRLSGGGVGVTFQPSNQGLVFLEATPDPEATRRSMKTHLMSTNSVMVERGL